MFVCGMFGRLFAAFVCLVGYCAGAQTVITLAGGNSSGSTAGSTNGVGTAALFNSPHGVVVDTSGSVIVTDQNSHRVRLIYSNLTVITLAGGSTTGTTSGSTNGVGSAALFRNPQGVALDASGNVIVADFNNHMVRLIFPNRTVITLAGGSTTGVASGIANGIGTAALFYNPAGVAVDSSGCVIVADQYHHKIRLIYPNLTVITLAGGSTTGVASGFADGVGTAALFFNPIAVAVDSSGTVIVADPNNHKVRLIYPNRTVVTIAGGSTTGTASGSSNGVGTAALFNWPYSVAVDSAGNVVVADITNQKVRLIYPNRSVITLAGGSLSGTASGSANGVGTAALFNSPAGVATDNSGNVFVADLNNHKIRLICPFSCSPGTYANLALRGCTLCPPGSFSSTTMALSCSPCASGTFAKSFSATSCEACPGGHFCPVGTSSWARLNCGRGFYCVGGSSAPIPCPIQLPPPPYTSWEQHPLKVQGPAFIVETAGCRNQCFWNFTSGDGFLSTC